MESMNYSLSEEVHVDEYFIGGRGRIKNRVKAKARKR
jgi:hypothetical protein